MKKFISLCFIMILAAAGYSFYGTDSNDPNQQKQRLIITGSSTVAPLASELALLFEKSNPNVRIDVQTGGSSRGVNDARSGVANIGMASRPLKDSGKNLQAFTIAHDGICMIVHRDNPVKTLSPEKIRAIYRGQTKNWKALNHVDAPITVVNKAAGRSTLELFIKHFKLKPQNIKASIIIGDNEQGIKTVAGNPQAIAYVSIGAAQYAAEHGQAIHLLPLNNVAATVNNVKEGTFPLSRPLNFVTANTPTGLSKRFIEFSQSAKANATIKKQYFVPTN